MNGLKNALQRLRAPSATSERRGSSDRGSGQRLPGATGGDHGSGGSAQGVQLLPVSGSNVQQLLPVGQQPWDAAAGQQQQSRTPGEGETRSRPVNLGEVRGV